jgi:hypothetical protein
MAMFDSNAPGRITPPAPTDLVEQRFSSVAVIAAFAVALGFGSVAASILSARNPIGIAFLAVAVGAAVMGLRLPYAAIVRPDGSLTFKALTRVITTSLAHVDRITRNSGGRGGTAWVFYFDGTRAQLNDRGGRRLAAYVAAHNPRVEYPPSLDRRPY